MAHNSAVRRFIQPSPAPSFDYFTAFGRNIGWLTESEQETLREKRVAIAGMGGVGGVYATTLARLGVAKFVLADFDRFELPNFNRQVGAGVSTLGRSKVEVIAEMVREINPDCEIQIHPQGVRSDNLRRFFRKVDLYLDGLDAFAFDARESVYAFCADHGIPATVVAPLGMSAALMNFLPGRMTFEQYFRLSGRSEEEKSIRFLVGLAPSLLHRTCLVDPTRVSLKERAVPSIGLACQLCAGVAASEALKILLGRGRVWAAPHAIQFDAYSNRMAHTWRPGGNRHLLNRLAIVIAKRTLKIS